MLTKEQIAHFETFGFVIRRHCFSESEMEEICRAFDDVLTEDRQGQPFDGAARQAVLGIIEKRPLLSGLVEDDRIYQPLEQLLGPGFVWIGSDGNLYVGDTGWHPDGSDLDYGRIKVALYLDTVTKDTGCLRVVPGSHRMPLHGALDPLKGQRRDPDHRPFGTDGSGLPCFPLESEPGDVVFFNQNLWHAAYGGRTGAAHVHDELRRAAEQGRPHRVPEAAIRGQPEARGEYAAHAVGAHLRRCVSL